MSTLSRAHVPLTLSRGVTMPYRGFRDSFAGRRALGCVVVLAFACRPYAGGPVLPRDSTGVVTPGATSEVGGESAKIEGDKLMANSPRTVTDMLVGRFPGVEVFKTANGGSSIRIRGSRSMKSTDEPLFVLDGYPQHNGSASLLDLDPHDIKSIEVLKGADASMYGARGANGVIRIVTKKGS